MKLNTAPVPPDVLAAVVSCGVAGTVAGVTLLDGAEAVLSPISLRAVMRQLTGEPLVRPVTAMGGAEPFWLPLPQLAVYPVTALPPSTVGGVNATLNWALPRVATTAVGASGTVAGVTLADGADAGPSPTSLTAATLQVTGTPLVSPPTRWAMPYRAG